MPHKLVIAMGLGKPKGDSSAPPSYKSSPPDTEPDPTDPNEPTEPATDEMGGGGITPDEVDYSSGDLCETCSNMGADGNCAKYNFPVDKTGHCEAGYEPKGGDMSRNGLGGGDASQIPPAV